MKLLHFPIIKLTLCLIIGILISYIQVVPLNLSISISIGLLILLLISFTISKYQVQKTKHFGIIVVLTTMSLGVLVVNLHEQRNFKNHYSKIVPVENDSSFLITFQVREILKSTVYQEKYVVNVLNINGKIATGKLLLNVRKDSISKPLKVDDILMTYTRLSKLNLPLNPYQFNYNNYLKKQYINNQIQVDMRSYLKINSEPITLWGYAALARSKIHKKLVVYQFEKDELAMIDALLLGQRKDISPETYNNYVNAGTIHIMAVSGLHVGIIFLLLQWLLRPLERLKHGKVLKMLFIIIFLWNFAVIAGLSASVTRTVLMFTVVAIGMNLNRQTNIFNTLAISMFFLLLIKPRFLLDVGFQMSYLAVISIVSIQPLLKKIWYPKNRIVRYFWSILTVTLAAQIGVVPISLFYFHQFPGLFFISNLVVIPILTLNLVFGILIILMSLLNILPQWVADIFGYCVNAMNSFVSWISHQERFVFKDISFGIFFVITSYILIISIYSYLKKPTYSKLIYFLVAILLLQGAFMLEKSQNNSSEFVVFHKSRFSVIGIKENTKLALASNMDSFTKSYDKTIRNYKVGNSISSIEPMELQSVYHLQNEKLLVVDSVGVYNVQSFKPNYILLRNSPKINLNRLIDSLRPKLIIADASNYRSYIERWKTTCEEQKILFHHTREKGAFVLRY